MLPLLHDIYASGLARDANNQPRDAFPTTLPREEGEFLARVVAETGAREVLEIGMAFGVSTLWLFQGMADPTGRITSVDPFQAEWFDRIGILNIERAGLADRHTCIERPSHEALPALLSDQRRFDAVFIDGNHRFEHTLVDCFFALRLVPIGGHILFHDVWLPSVQKVLTYILRSDLALEPAPAFLPPRSTLLPSLAEHALALCRSPREPLAALTMRQHGFDRIAVFRKTADQSESDFATAWDRYSGC